MGLIRKTLSVGTAGAIDFRSDKERIAAYTKATKKQAKKQTRLMQQAQRAEMRQEAPPLGRAWRELRDQEPKPRTGLLAWMERDTERRKAKMQADKQ